MGALGHRHRDVEVLVARGGSAGPGGLPFPRAGAFWVVLEAENGNVGALASRVLPAAFYPHEMSERAVQMVEIAPAGSERCVGDERNGERSECFMRRAPSLTGGELLARLRCQKGEISQQRLAHLVGMSRSMLAEARSGDMTAIGPRPGGDRSGAPAL